jgi:hypothetical protein
MTLSVSHGGAVAAVNFDQSVYYRAKSTDPWSDVGGLLTEVAISGDGKLLWGINAPQKIYYKYVQSSGWVEIDGRGVKIATDYTGTIVWLITAAQTIFYRNGINGVSEVSQVM